MVSRGSPNARSSSANVEGLRWTWTGGSVRCSLSTWFVLSSGARCGKQSTVTQRGTSLPWRVSRGVGADRYHAELCLLLVLT